MAGTACSTAVALANGATNNGTASVPALVRNATEGGEDKFVEAPLASATAVFKNISGADKRERGRERIERAWNLVNGGDGLLDRGGARRAVAAKRPPSTATSPTTVLRQSLRSSGMRQREGSTAVALANGASTNLSSPPSVAFRTSAGTDAVPSVAAKRPPSTATSPTTVLRQSLRSSGMRQREARTSLKVGGRASRSSSRIYPGRTRGREGEKG
jgi:hypothetical protein